MTEGRKILIVDDDADDRLMIKDAFEELGISYSLQFMENGIVLMDYLNKSIEENENDLPCLILLDLNMPKKDGREVLAEMKSNDILKVIPVIIFTTSQSNQDIKLSYQNGANSYITKPSTFEMLLIIVKSISDYWLTLNCLPEK